MRFLRELASRITWERVGVGSFLVFLLLTPLAYKIQLRAGRLQEGIYVEPLMPFLVLSISLFLWTFFRQRRISLWLRREGMRELWPSVKKFLIPNLIAKLFYLLLLVLLLSWIYGVVLTGNFAWGDLLRLIKYGLYFLVFPLSIQAGRILGKRWIYGLLAALFLVGMAASIVSLYRIYQFVAEGNVIDFWQYSLDSRSVGFLGQYLDLSDFSIGQIPKAAHATFGLYLSVILGVGLVFLSQVRLVSFRFAGFLFGIGIIFAALLYTLSRGAVATGSLVILAGLLWFARSKKFWALVIISIFLFLESSVLIQINREVYEKFASTFPGLEQVTSRWIDITSPVGKGIIRSGQGLAKFLGFIEEIPPEIPSIAVVRKKEIEAYPGLGVEVDQSLGERIVVWGNTFNLIRSRPLFFIFGVGYSIDNLLYFTGGTVVYPHSLFLDLWARGGLLALALVLVIWLLLFGKTIQFWFSPNKLVQAFGFALFGFLIGWFLDNLISGEQFFSDAPMLAFWGVLGLITALSKVRGQRSEVRKVLIALTSSEVGGAPKVVYDLLLAMTRSKIASPALRDSHKSVVSSQYDFVVALPKGGPFVKKFRDLGVKVYNVPLSSLDLRGLTGLLGVVRKENVDLINSHGKGAGLYARLVGAVLSIPVVHTFHGIHYFRYGKVMRWVYFNFERLMSQFTRLIINVSASQQREGIALKLFPREKARVVENGMSTRMIGAIKSERLKIRKRLGIGEKDFMAVVLARFDPIKGHARLVEILPMVLAKVPRLKVVFVGDGEEENKIKKLVKELGVSGAVVFAGRQDNPFPILSSAEVLLHPSYHEGLPLSPLEASALAVPVVAAQAVGNVDAVLSGKTGYLVDFREAAIVAEALGRLSQSAALRRRMGERGRRWVAERFSMEKFVGDTLAVYQESLKN